MISELLDSMDIENGFNQVKSKLRSVQIKAALEVNKKLLSLYSEQNRSTLGLKSREDQSTLNT